jgi:branched-chain amino acid transport system permease protein
MAQIQINNGADAGPQSKLTTLLSAVPARVWVVGLILLLIPNFTSDFLQYQVFGWAFVLGLISLSLMFLAGYGGMVSLVQMTVAAVAGYCVAIFGTSGVAEISMGWPWVISVIVAIVIATLFCVAAGALAVRTEGIYTIMITLAIASAFFYFTRQNYVIFNGFTGFNRILPPQVFGIDFKDPTAYYYLTLGCAALGYFAVVYVSRTPFGLALQGVRDNPRRMAALGYSVNAHRIAAYAFSGVLAAVGGILLTWSNGQISPGTAAVGPVIDILVIAVIGGINTPIGPFVGAIVYVLLRTYALDVLVALNLSGERFKLLIGLSFLIIVYWSPDGLCGLWQKMRGRLLGRGDAGQSRDDAGHKEAEDA